jgi:hypothetical protein
VQIYHRKADQRKAICRTLVSREPSASCCTELTEGLGEFVGESLVVFGKFTDACAGNLETLEQRRVGGALSRGHRMRRCPLMKAPAAPDNDRF